MTEAAAPATARSPEPAWKPILSGRNPRLDGVRGFAMMWVLGTHLLVPWEGGVGITDAVVSVLRLGWPAVDLFFVLSGYLITGILLRNRDRPVVEYYVRFEARRLFRIFPLYYSVLLIVLVIIPQFEHFARWDYFWFENSSHEDRWYWLYLSNFQLASTHQYHHSFLAITWSLAIEEQYYILWPTVVYFIARRRLGWLCFGLILYATVQRWVLVLTGAHHLTVYALPTCRMDALATGSLVAILVRSERAGEIMHALAKPVIFICLVIIAGVTVPGYLEGYRGGHYDRTAFQLFGYNAFNTIFGCMIVLAIYEPPRRFASWFLELRFLRHVAKHSYAMYLFHLPARWLVLEGLGISFYTAPLDTPARFWMTEVVFFAVCFTVTMVLSYISWYLLEARFLALKKYFPYQS